MPNLTEEVPGQAAKLSDWQIPGVEKLSSKLRKSFLYNALWDGNGLAQRLPSCGLSLKMSDEGVLTG